MRHSITLGLGLTLAAITVSACGGSESAGDSTASYCARIQAYKDKADSLDVLFDGDEPPASDDMKKAFTTMQDMSADMKKGAPAEIKADVALMSKGIDDVVEFFEQYDWDIMAIAASPDVEKLDSLLSGDEMNAASDRLDEFSETTCGIKTES